MMNTERAAKSYSRIISGDVLNAYGETRKIIESARREASELIKNAEKKASFIRSKAYRDGLNAGKSDAIGVMLLANRHRLVMEQTAVNDLIDLCMDIVESFIRIYQKEHEAWITDRVRQGLAGLQDQRAVTVRMNPRDLKAHHDLFQQMAQAGTLEGVVRFLPDYDLETGDCVFESTAGTINASVLQCLNGIKNFLLESATGYAEKGWKNA
jgi:flagellar biosynthesis/type III secretory pathway protein FliH